MTQETDNSSLDRSSPLPLWAQLHAQLTQRIESGDFDNGFPSEAVLQDHYEVSRSTVREAIRRLRDDGLLIVQRGRASRRVPRQEIQQSLTAIYSLFESAAAAGLTQRSVVKVQEIRQDSVAAERLGLEPSTSLFYMERLRLVRDEPLALDKVWLPASSAAPLLSVSFEYKGLYAELSDRCEIRIEDGWERIRAVTLTASECKLLNVGSEVPGFAISRLGIYKDQPIEWRQTLVRADRFELVADFSSSNGFRTELNSASTSRRRQ